MAKTNKAERERRLVKRLAEETLNGELRWWWLSFADGNRPLGDQFLGACIVRARGMGSALMLAHGVGINPGGEVRGYELPEEAIPATKWVNRLLTRAQCEEFDNEHTQ